MKNFFIVTNHKKDPGEKTGRKIVNYLLSQGASQCKIFFRDDLWDKERTPMESFAYELNRECPDNTDCIIVLGGDGTMIQAVGALYERNIPFIGINLGTLGYLTECDPDHLMSTLNNLLSDRYSLEERMLIEGSVIRDGGEVDRHFAVNDIVVARNGRLQIIHSTLFVDDVEMTTYSADGIIVSTPTGSTAYNLSAGGPICFPNAELMVVTPICAHAINSRSIVLPKEVTVNMKILDDPMIRNSQLVTYDGGHYFELKKDDIVRIRALEGKCRLVRTTKNTFMDTLRMKMSSI